MKRVAVGLMAMALCGPVALAVVFTGPVETVSAGPSPQARAEIPSDLLLVYQAAALTCPGLPWTLLAAIGWVESRHAEGRADPISGDVEPHIIGPPLDGKSGRAAIADATQPDGWAHALGPMQFLAGTWRVWAVLAPDRPPDAGADPHNAWDAIFTAARFLCAGRDHFGDARTALARYSPSNAYADEVLGKAAVYADDAASAPTGAVRGSVAAVIAAAMSQIGVPYRWGAESPGVGFDCSGLVQWAFAQAGVSLPRTTTGQVLAGTPVERPADLRPGDLIFTTSVRSGGQFVAGHVAIYTGGRSVIVAPRSGAAVVLAPLPSSPDAIRRLIN